MALTFTTSCLSDALDLFRYYQRLAERAMEQTPDDGLFTALDAESNSIAVIIKHLSGNMLSRWTDFLSSDGEKPTRHRDMEFESPATTRREMMAQWDAGWKCALDSLSSLSDADWGRTVRIRGEAHSVLQAVHRNLTHTVYHLGQIIYLSKHFAGSNWTAVSIPRGKSKEFNAKVSSRELSQR